MQCDIESDSDRSEREQIEREMNHLSRKVTTNTGTHEHEEERRGNMREVSDQRTEGKGLSHWSYASSRRSHWLSVSVSVSSPPDQAAEVTP